ncbi:MAG: EthD family reductase [Maribacter sp.]|nr:EthD family reductase [Maribacter sp.]
MKKGMIKVSVFYPNADGKKFDMDYYIGTHVPLVSKTLGTALKGASYDKGLGGGAPGSPATYVSIANLFFDSIEEFGEAFGAAAPTFQADLPNFTNIEPIVQISEVMV